MLKHERLCCLCPVDPGVVQHHHDLPLNVAQQMLEESDDVPTPDCPRLCVVEESTFRRDRTDGREFLPIGRECDQGRDAPGRPRAPSHAFQREPNLIQIHQGRALSDLFFPTPERPVLSRTRSGVHCALPPAHPAFAA